MNILVLTSHNHIIVRPDTTWERDNEDIYLPEFVDSVSCSPVLFARLSKPGRSVDARFSERYYDAFSYGVLLFPENLISGGEEDYASASCLDHTSFLPDPLSGKSELAAEDNVFTLQKDGKDLFGNLGGTAAMIEDAIAAVTARCYIRTGDLLAIEIRQRSMLCTRKESGCGVEGKAFGKTVVDFKVIF